MSTDVAKPVVGKSFKLDPDMVYDLQWLVTTTGLSEGTIEAARQVGELVFIQLGERILYRGASVTSWLLSNEQRCVPRAVVQVRTGLATAGFDWTEEQRKLQEEITKQQAQAVTDAPKK